MSVVGALLLAISVMGLLPSWEGHLLLALVIGLESGVVLAWAVDCYPVDVTADGIKCYDVFSRYHFAPWPTIDGVRPINVLGLRYLRVQSSATPRPLWVPLFLSDMPGFCAAIVDRAGPDHPLAEALVPVLKEIPRKKG